MTLTAIPYAVLAVAAAQAGDRTTARAHIAKAQQHAGTGPRRDRQLIEIAALVVAGAHDRAAGLAVVHTADFPDDTTLLAPVARHGR
jgi:hypothetical protein